MGIKESNLFISGFRYGDNEPTSQQCLVSLTRCSLLKEMEVVPIHKLEAMEERLKKTEQHLVEMLEYCKPPEGVEHVYHNAKNCLITYGRLSKA